MRNLGRVGGKKSGDARRKHAVERRIFALVGVWETCRDRLSLEEVENEMAEGRPNLSGGSHDDDWRCPGCHQFHSAKRWFCRRCGRLIRKRTTRKRIRELEAEHRPKGILRKHGLDGLSDVSSDGTPGPEEASTASTGIEGRSARISWPQTVGLGAVTKLDLLVPTDED